MNETTKFQAVRDDGFPGLPGEVTITVYQDIDGNYIPESDDLGVGHKYQSPKRAARDMARRHGYTLIPGS